MNLIADTSSCVDFRHWTGERKLATIGTNSGSETLPFQGWRRFKEAFAPELIQRAVFETGDVKHILDPFGGSGTTALAAQFLGAHPTTIEVNPFLSDLIEAKICPYDMDKLVNSYAEVVDKAYGCTLDPSGFFLDAPKTFLEPGVKGNYLFSTAVAGRLCAYRSAIESLQDPASRRLLKVLLASLSVSVSNAVISGKGRRYRRNWKNRPITPEMVDETFQKTALAAIFDLRRFEARRCRNYSLLRGDARQLISEVQEVDVSIFSPPYPNSFDYTDVYNIELWALGYLKSSGDNLALRKSTLRSHVQIARDFSATECGGKILISVLDQLTQNKDKLWNRHIPSMVGAYFSDMKNILADIKTKVRKNGRIYIVVGDSRYANINIPVANILTEEANSLGYELISSEPFRSMRSSPQQGGQKELAESLIVLRN